MVAFLKLEVEGMLQWSLQKVNSTCTYLIIMMHIPQSYASVKALFILHCKVQFVRC